MESDLGGPAAGFEREYKLETRLPIERALEWGLEHGYDRDSRGDDVRCASLCLLDSARYLHLVFNRSKRVFKHDPINALIDEMATIMPLLTPLPGESVADAVDATWIYQQRRDKESS